MTVEWYWLVVAYVSGVVSIPTGLIIWFIRDYVRAQRGD